jgi:FKBP-type peptidyl-prolyl cis-trans isomerase
MKYIFIILTLAIAVNVNAQSDMQHTPDGVSYLFFTHNTGDRIKVADVLTFDIVQKTDKDSVLMSSYASGNKAHLQVADPKGITDPVEGNLMQILMLATVNDSLLVKFPTDSIFKGHEDQRPPFFPKGSDLNFVIKIRRVQSLTEAIAEMKAAEVTDAAKYIADHKLALKTTASGLKYVITKQSLKPKPLKGDTLLVNYTGRTLDDKVFDSSIESVAKAANLNQPGRTYEPIQFVVGTGGVIPGWDEGLLLLNEGEKATLVIPSALAYGDKGAGDDIKPYSTLVFDVELVKIKPGKHDLSKKQGVDETPSNISAIEAGASKGSITKPTRLRSAPSLKGKIIEQLAVNTELYILSDKNVGGFCKAIDVKTKKTGWVYKGALKLTEKAKK